MFNLIKEGPQKVLFEANKEWMNEKNNKILIEFGRCNERRKKMKENRNRERHWEIDAMRKLNEMLTIERSTNALDRFFVPNQWMNFWFWLNYTFSINRTNKFPIYKFFFFFRQIKRLDRNIKWKVNLVYHVFTMYGMINDANQNRNVNKNTKNLISFHIRSQNQNHAFLMLREFS